MTDAYLVKRSEVIASLTSLNEKRVCCTAFTFFCVSKGSQYSSNVFVQLFLRHYYNSMRRI